MDIEPTVKKRRPRQSSFEKAIGLLSRRGYAIQEMHDALLKKDYPQEDVDDCMQMLIENRYLNDENFAYERVRTRALLSKWGKRRIHTELKNKGVSENVILQAFERFEAGSDERMGVVHNWQQEATELVQRKYGAFPNELYQEADSANDWEEKQEILKQIQKEKARRINFLLRRGFTSEQAMKALNST